MVQAHWINQGITVTPYGEPFLAQEKKNIEEEITQKGVLSRKRLWEKMQCTAEADAVHCKDGCSALRERLQCTASEMGKRSTEIASPILDGEMEGNDALIR